MSIEFPDRLRELIKQKGVSAREVARNVGVSNSLLSKYLNGVHTPKLDIMKRLATYFGVSQEYLSGEDDIEGELKGIVKYAHVKGLTAGEIRDAVDFALKVKGKE